MVVAGGSPPRLRKRGAVRLWWAAVPVASIGFLSFVPFLAYAIMRGRKRDWAVFATYLALTVAMIVAVSAIPSNGSASGALGGFIIALAGAAAIHACILFRPMPSGLAQAGPEAVSARQRNRAAIREAQSRIDRRKDARHLVQTNPALARDLRIGRPDLPRDYDDGGLIDVNEVPGATLAAQLGLTSQEVADVIAARGQLGRFTSADELCAYTKLSPERVDELRDLMIF
jgi:hypothetical protein